MTKAKPLKNRHLFINLLIGVFLLSIPILTSPDFGTGELLKISGFQKNFFSYVLLLLFYYGNYYFFIPKFYVKKRWWIYGGIVVLSFLIILYVPSLLFGQGVPNGSVMLGPGDSPPPGFEGSVIPAPPDGGQMNARPEPFGIFEIRDTFVFQFLFALIISLLLRLDNQLKEVKSEKLRSEVSYLKAQINPHFLFNTLNSIYALTLTKSERAPKAILKLSDMMRYVVTESDTDYVPLEREIAYISDYVSLQQLRMSKKVDFKFEVEGNPEGKIIAPIIIINFVENAFKYGVNPDKPSKIHIFISVDEEGVLLKVENKITVDKKSLPGNMEEGSKNTKKRLLYRYPGKHKLDITENSEIYKVKLYIELE